VRLKAATTPCNSPINLHVKKDGHFCREADKPVSLPPAKSLFLIGSHINYTPTRSGKPRATGGQVVSVIVTTVWPRAIAFFCREIPAFPSARHNCQPETHTQALCSIGSIHPKTRWIYLNIRHCYACDSRSHQRQARDQWTWLSEFECVTMASTTFSSTKRLSFACQYIHVCLHCHTRRRSAHSVFAEKFVLN